MIRRLQDAWVVDREASSPALFSDREVLDFQYLLQVSKFKQSVLQNTK